MMDTDLQVQSVGRCRVSRRHDTHNTISVIVIRTDLQISEGVPSNSQVTNSIGVSGGAPDVVQEAVTTLIPLV